ncbi:unnamed protein product, partial [Symbiodinium sp. KB8]
IPRHSGSDCITGCVTPLATVRRTPRPETFDIGWKFGMAVATLTPTRLTVENSEIQLGSAVTDTRGEIIMNLELLIDLMSEATIDQ